MKTTIKLLSPQIKQKFLYNAVAIKRFFGGKPMLARAQKFAATKKLVWETFYKEP